MRIFLMGAAAIALAASGASADPGKGNGGGHGNGGGKMAAAGGPSHGGGHGQAQANKGKGPQADAGRAMKADHGPVRVAQGKPEKAAKGPAVRSQGNSKANGKAHAKAAKANAKEIRRDVRDYRDVRDVREVRYDRDRRDRDDNVRVVRSFVGFDRDVNRGLVNGCPPGLAKKNNGCLPPGLAKDRNDYRDYRSDYYRPSWFGYDAPRDGRYYYDAGYLYRVNDRGSVLGYLPLLGGALSVGNPWPSYYEPVPVPDYYSQYYNLGPVNSYRYADDVLYRVDPQSNMITSIAALLTGDQFAVGQPMPAGYDIYNVPYGYRDQYYDTPQANYRYADGYVYQVDPKTQLIAAVIQLLT
ncbi:hypothetical protein GCM10011515_17990 [Tsuneonella deserti]|uniref:Nickel/cobalt transporter regulator n=1 Tax=Tsuneonella deserti TaxID=2035528 RepID=A0ABQ1SBF7_9SPHN|nr:hypothetical protein [Tsuneonella deserti]GGD98551.1 hypothetical protein GCM10011515_17990 [Tsuneonella deserti]